MAASSEVHAPYLIGVDWGGSNLRALLLDAGGRALECRAAPLAAIDIPAGRHLQVFDGVIGDWRARGLPVLACGMAGARNGWHEAPYVQEPADAAALAAGLVEPVAGIWIVPGVRCVRDGNDMDVMRGEETQAIGALALDPSSIDARVICPGTHSKWIEVRSGAIARFRTCVTGELFAIISAAWRQIMDAGAAQSEGDAGAFRRGVRIGASTPLASALFTLRAGYATRTLPQADMHEYLSGLLIGSEIAAYRDAHDEYGSSILIGAPELAARYVEAFATLGLPAPHALDAQSCVARGLLHIWNARPSR